MNKKKYNKLMEENTILKKNLSFAQDNKENECKYVVGKMRGIEEGIGKQVIKVESSYRRAEWQRKCGTLCEEYEKNIAILQKEYLKAVINLSANELNTSKETIRKLVHKVMSVL